MSGGLDLATATNRLSEVALFRRVEVANDSIASFVSALSNLERAVPKDDEFWDVVVRRLRRTRFDLFSTPVPFNDPSLGLVARLDSLESDLSTIDSGYPEQAPAARDTIFRLRVLAGQSENPMAEHVRRLVGEYEPLSIAVVTRSTRSARSAESHIAAALEDSQVALSLIQGLGESVPFLRDLLVCIGPFRWYSPALVEAPHAPINISLCYAQVRETDLPDYRLPRSTRPLRQLLIQAVQGASLDLIDPQEALPQVSWAWVDRPESGGRTEVEDEERLARPVLLAGGLAVLIDAEPAASLLTLELNTDGAARVLRRIPAEELVEGMFLVLRTEGGGDFVEEIADRLLSDNAARLREMQREWKRGLVRHIRSDGAAAVASELIRRGSERASAGNVRRWAGDELLRTELRSDFQAIMSLVGLGASVDEYWRAMGTLHSAHQRAGVLIRKMLLRAMTTTGAASELASGRLDFTLEDQMGGQLSAVRVESLADMVVSVQKSRIGRLTVVDEA